MIYQNCGDTEREAEPGMERPVKAKKECVGKTAQESNVAIRSENK